MKDFTVSYLPLSPGVFEGADIDFYEVGFCPVVYVNDSKQGFLGAIALNGQPLTFPLTALYSYDARQLSKDEFFELFPEIKNYFTIVPAPLPLS